MSDSEDKTPLRPIAAPEMVKANARHKKASRFSRLSLWSQIIGAVIAISSLFLALRGMFGDFPLQGSNHALGEHFSTILLFSFLGSFGFVPGFVLFWWGRTLSRHPYKPLMALLPALFSLPFWGLAVFLLSNSGMVYGTLSILVAICLCLIALYVWRRQPKIPPTET